MGSEVKTQTNNYELNEACERWGDADEDEGEGKEATSSPSYRLRMD